MPVIRVTEADLAKTQNLAASWYEIQCTKVLPPATSGKGDSVNFVLEFAVIGGVTNGGIPVPGKVIPFTLNTKLMGKVEPIWLSCLGKKVVPGADMDLDELLNKKCDGKVGQREWNGQLMDEIQAFLPLGKSKEAAF